MNRRIRCGLVLLSLCAAASGCNATPMASKPDPTPSEASAIVSQSKDMSLLGVQEADLSSLSWESDHVVQTVELPLFRLADGTPPEVEALPGEIRTFFEDEYGKQFDPLDSIYPLMGYGIGTYDMNQDGSQDYFIRGWPNMGGQMLLPEVYLFLSQPAGDLKRVLVGLEQDTSIRVLDHSHSGLPDLLYGDYGDVILFDGVEQYRFATNTDETKPPASAKTSPPEAVGDGQVWVPLHIPYIPETSGPEDYLAANFRSHGNLLANSYALIVTSDGVPLQTKMLREGADGYGVFLKLKAESSLWEDILLFPDEIKFIDSVS